MSISETIEAVKAGDRVTREGWNGDYLMIINGKLVRASMEPYVITDEDLYTDEFKREETLAEAIVRQDRERTPDSQVINVLPDWVDMTLFINGRPAETEVEAAIDLDICGYAGKWSKAKETAKQGHLYWTNVRQYFLELGGEWVTGKNPLFIKTLSAGSIPSIEMKQAPYGTMEKLTNQETQELHRSTKKTVNL